MANPPRVAGGQPVNIRVERKDGAIITIEVVGDRRVEARPTAPPSREERRLDVGPSEGAACVP